MVHQAHNIPWNVFVSNLSWGSTKIKGDRIINLHPRGRKDQGKELTYFLRAFIRTIQEHTKSERAKYPSHIGAKEPHDIVLNPATVHNITPTVRRWRSYGFRGDCPSGVCNTFAEKECRCVPIPDEERRAAAFLRPYGQRRCYVFLRDNKDAFFNIEIVKTLILHGEMEALLQACALPGVELAKWWEDSECQCEYAVLGWDQVCIKALRAYICLNTIDSLPELWDKASGSTEETDYRRSRFYQYTLRTCTGEEDHISEVTTYPHRAFFGIGDNQFRGEYTVPQIRRSHWLRWEPQPRLLYIKMYDWPRSNHYGKVPIEEFLTLENPAYMGHPPSQSGVALIQSYLFEKGLPAELVLMVMDLADYKPIGRLSEPHDPFHPSNRMELDQYVTYCWQLLVRCEMLASALDMRIPWEKLIADCLVEFFASDRDGQGRFYWNARDEEGAITHRVFIKP
ncbi:hypothetical protein N7539_005994 [Penicillium diatomitis]|uniref:Uncharacterized protein n=1 Tax=Penicillium diatomitis TaxID=2819901 RepID=A0A9W9X5R6_9EURO|nr:uncharacterized protein N7539_005994 [Penicillium diatomitis]KAJ5484198.1 hypothetical protein N7539_005994 [Penicillium diatomitis]